MKNSAFNPSRRGFMQAGALAGGGLVVGFTVPMASKLAEAAPLYQPNAYIKIGADNVVTVVVGYAEMGQGPLTAIPMMIAEELDADWSKIRVEQAPAEPEYKNPVFGIQATGGSTTVRGAWEPMRRAGAAARELLVAAAAKEWNVDPSTLRTERGYVIGTGGKRIAYGALSDKAAALPKSENPKLKDPKDFKILGQPMKRVDTASKVNGTAKFGMDVQLPGMLIACVARSPVTGGKVASFDAAKAKAVPGVKQVLQIPSGVAVLADNTWSAKTGRDALEIKWDEGPNAGLSTEGMKKAMSELVDKPAVVARKDGDVAANSGAKKIEATYYVPYLAHACMEPVNFTAWVKPNELELWGPTQAPGVNQAVLSKVAGVDVKQTKVHTMFLGGGFGRKFAQDFAIEAVLLSKAANAPVKMVMTREDDTRAQFYRPTALVKFSGSIDDQGKPVSMQARTVCPSIFKAAGRALPEGIDRPAVEGLKEWPYEVPNSQVEWAQYEPPIGVWFWRSVGSSQNAWFVESFIDEMAVAAGKDAFEYRRELLAKEPRLKGVLEMAAEKAGWGKPAAAGRARGIAVAESFGAYVAEVAEVSVSPAGEVRVHKVVAAIDCGQIVNPEIIRRQVESAIVYGLTAALYGQITLKDGKVEQSNFTDYPMVRMNETPQVEVHIVSSMEKPGGVGEPGLPPLAPAVTNAIYALTKKRVRSLPINSAELKSA